MTGSSEAQAWMTRSRTKAVLLAALVVAGCGQGIATRTASTADEAAPAEAVPSDPADVAAPEVFQVTEPGLWDGRPSLGGTWVAHPDVVDPERVRIVNQANGQTVVGALFRRERDLPGPALQVSSDAAEALGMLAGAPATLEVVALRRTEAPGQPEDPAAPAPAEEGATAPPDMEATALKMPVASRPQGPFVQLGSFDGEAPAKDAAGDMAARGLPARPAPDPDGGRVRPGPPTTKAEPSAPLDHPAAEGFADAVLVRS